MSGFRHYRAVFAAASLCLPLVACGGEPSETDMKAAIEQTYGGMNKELGQVGKLVGKDLSTKVKTFKKLGCAKAEGNPGYRCDFEMTVDGPLGESTQKASGRFVQADKGWSVMEK